jgi:ADP-ribose pyrophosphatase YjhB (NUDIX family)
MAEPIVCAGAVIRDAAGRLLMIRRGSEPARGKWSLPGGRVEPGEPHAAAAAREVLEETGLVVEVGDLLATVEVMGYVVHDFSATVIGGRLRAGDDAIEVMWCDDATVESLDTTSGLVEELRRMRVL